MPSYKLIYFNARGRAEETRLLFAAAGVKYEDCRLNGEEFAKLKAGGTLPFGQLPVLEVDGKMLAQSNTMFKYVAREVGFAPTDSFELANADMIVDGLMDVMIKVMKFAFEKDEEKKKALAKTFYEKDLSASLEIFEKLLKSNQDGKYFVGNKMTFADVKFFTSVDGLFQDRKEDVPAALNDFPLLKELFSRVLANPGIKEWLKKRPVTPM